MDKRVQAHLDAIKYFCDPKQKTPAHITVRGPYADAIDVRQFSSIIEGARASIVGPGIFFREKQNTVFLATGLHGLRSIWHKPDFNFKPHITLYDGPSREFASSLRDVLRKHRLFFTCQVTGLLEMRTVSGQYSFDMKMNVDIELLKPFVSRSVILRADEFNEKDRLEFVNSLLFSLLRYVRQENDNSNIARGNLAAN